MGVAELLAKDKPENLKVVSVKLNAKLINACRKIRQETGKTNTEVYTALLMEGLEVYRAKKAPNGRKKRRGRKKASS